MGPYQIAESMSYVPEMEEKSPLSSETARGPLDADLLDAELSFYRGYPWCLNASPHYAGWSNTCASTYAGWMT